MGIRTGKKHPDKALTAVGIRALKKPGRYADGNGLYLKVAESGAKRWELRTVVRGKRRDIGLGGLRLVSLAEAREEARKYRQMARDHGDPLAEKRRARKVVPTFKEAAEAVHKEHTKAWKNAKHSDQWINTLKAYVFPVFGDRKIDEVQTSDILKAAESCVVVQAGDGSPRAPAHQDRSGLGQGGRLPVRRQPDGPHYQGAAAPAGPQRSFCRPPV
jgi:hypothetical protein